MQRVGRVGLASLHLERCRIESEVVPQEEEGADAPFWGERVALTGQGMKTHGGTRGEGSDNPLYVS